MKNVTLALSTLIALGTMIPAAVAGEYPTKTFDAKYDIKASSGNTQLRMISDGKGHFKTETSASGFKSVTIVDYLGKKQTTLIEQGKIAMQSKLPSGTGYVCDDSSAKTQGAKSIGNKQIAGHPCHGYEYKTPGGKSEVWIADDVGVLVQSSTDTAAGKISYSLISVSTKAPGADEFKVPAGYKLQVQ
jgi:hypothetical protein